MENFGALDRHNMFFKRIENQLYKPAPCTKNATPAVFTPCTFFKLFKKYLYIDQMCTKLFQSIYYELCFSLKTNIITAKCEK